MADQQWGSVFTEQWRPYWIAILGLLRFLWLYDTEFQLQTVSDEYWLQAWKNPTFRGVMEHTVTMHSHQIRVCDESSGCCAAVLWFIRWLRHWRRQWRPKRWATSAQLQAPGRYVAPLRVAASPRQDPIKMEMLRVISASDLVWMHHKCSGGLPAECQGVLFTILVYLSLWSVVFVPMCVSADSTQTMRLCLIFQVVTVV